MQVQTLATAGDPMATILIVDDDATNVVVLEGILEAAGYQLVVAKNGYEALALLAQEPPDLILLDVMMPEMDGFTVCRHVKATPAWQHIPVIIITALDEAEDYARALDCGADDFMTKPFTFTVLLARVRGYLRAKHAMEELRHSEERYRRLVELSPDAVLVHCDGTIVYANVACVRLLGATNPDQLLGRPLMEIIHPDYTDIVVARLRQMQEQGVAVPLLEEKLVRLDGRVVNVEVASMPIPYQDSSAYLAVIRDITERLETRTALRAAKEAAETANLAKSQFLANMSHELRTPLNAIIGYSEILREEAEELDYTDFLSDLRKIHTAGKHLLSLINDVLDLAKIEAGKMPPYLEFFDVSTVIHDAVSTIDPLIGKNANTLHVQVADQVGTMYSDITKVRQSLLNLLSNACKFTKEGPITLTVTRETGADKEWLCFQVRDTGIGMSPEQIRRLFQPFLQADASTTRQYGGTGLGLTITQHFCHMLGGTITVESALGEGSTFTMRLPAAAPHEQENLETVQPPCTPQPCTAVRSTVTATPLILVIDDDPEARDLLKRVLAKEGFQVVTATTGEEGLHLARTLHPTAITLDILMDGMTGWDVLTALKADAALASIPVIMLTITDDQGRAFTMGATDFLTKPVDTAHLVRVLQRHQNGNAANLALVTEACGRLTPHNP